jgi:hypothetical protein
MFTIGAALCLSLFWFLRKKAHWLISGFFAVIGGAFFAVGFFGGLVAMVVVWIEGFALGLIPEPVNTGSAIAAICVFALVMVVVDVWRDKKLDEGGQWAAVCLPVLLLAAGGAMGGVGGDVVYSVAGAGTDVFGPVLGW